MPPASINYGDIPMWLISLDQTNLELYFVWSNADNDLQIDNSRLQVVLL